MAGLSPPRSRQQRAQLFLHPFRLVGARPPQPARHPPHVRVDNHSWNRKGIAEDDIGGLASDPGEGDQLGHRLRHLPVMALDHGPGATDQAGGLAAKKPGGADQCLDLLGRSRGQAGGVGKPGEQRRGHQVDARVRTLRRKDGGDQQLPG